MKALLKDTQGLRVARVPRPALERSDDVLIETALAGLCRTDCYVAAGLIPAKDPVILGHEFSGVVVEAGAAVENLSPGDRVAVMPVIPCGLCRQCRMNRREYCLNRARLGVERDGAFAEFVVVPAQAVQVLPTGLSFKLGAYAEPAAASLAVLKAGMSPGERGLIFGAGRIARLTERVLRAHGFSDVVCHDPFTAPEPPEADSFDYVIETVAGEISLEGMIAALSPRGKLVLKTRAFRPAGINLVQAVNKEISLHAVNYGSFTGALELLASGKLQVDDLLGEVYPLEEFEEVFREAGRGEQSKPFFYLNEAYVRDF